MFEGYHAHSHLAAAVDAPALTVVQAGVDLNGDTPRDDLTVYEEDVMPSRIF